MLKKLLEQATLAEDVKDQGAKLFALEYQQRFAEYFLDCDVDIVINDSEFERPSSVHCGIRVTENGHGLFIAWVCPDSFHDSGYTLSFRLRKGIYFVDEIKTAPTKNQSESFIHVLEKVLQNAYEYGKVVQVVSSSKFYRGPTDRKTMLKLSWPISSTVQLELAAAKNQVRTGYVRYRSKLATGQSQYYMLIVKSPYRSQAVSYHDSIETFDELLDTLTSVLLKIAHEED